MMAGAMVRRAACATAVLSLSMLAGCGSLSGLNPMSWFSDKPKPAELEAVTPKIAGRQVWAARVDSVQFPMAVAVSGASFTAAGTDGTVVALNADDGRELWRGNVGERLSAGVGSDGRFAAVVTRNNELVVMEAGALKWRQALSSRVVAAPLVAGERVFVMGVDRAVHAFDVLDGRRIWSLQRPGDALTLAQPGVVAAFKDTLLVGQGARLTGVDPVRGTVRWEVPLASPRGTNEVERLADLVGPVVRTGDTVCARAFQSAVACANAERASLLWSKNVGGINAVGGDAEFLFGGDASDRVTAWRTASGDVAWTHERFLNRGLSGPLSVGKTVVFGDFEGYVHFLARETGETLLRLPTDGSAVVGTPVRSGTTLLVTTRNGGLFAFRPE
ncbi:outer membrane protein assembly factor BamB [Ideonella sp. BN130291]|uniref:outer membrane protein assembly factor BamB n=1 Tax=Ideonella sp. BN130291 TaxID=3112940 RepID=UPI002E257F8F|nr:outer membrane protein assembly factor BamB [Ideonella sp. BN130291]